MSRMTTGPHVGSMLSMAALVIAICAGAPAPAQAQSSDTTGEQTDRSIQSGGDIIVTAQRRDQKLQDVPIAITALGGDALRRKGAVTFQDYAGAVPSLSYQYVGPTGYRGERDYAIRGIYGSNTVGFYIDETPVPIVDPELLDVARVEILRGPQATLYGSNSMGGTIRFITNQPKFSVFSGSADGGISVTDGGGFNNRQSLILNVPLIDDKLAARIAASHRDDSGFIDNYYDGLPDVKLVFSPANQQRRGVEKNWDDASAYNVRAILRYEPVNALTITPTVAYAQTKLDNAPTFFGNLPGTKVVRSVRQPESEKTFLASLSAKYTTDKFELVNSLSYFDKRNHAVEDTTQLNLGYTPSTGNALDTFIRNKNFYGESRAQTTFDGPINFLVGFLYGDTKQSLSQIILASGLSAANPDLPAIPGDLVFTAETSLKTIEKSIYGEARLKIFEHLEATVGLRRYDFKTQNMRLTAGFIGDGSPVDRTFKENGVRPRATLSWTPSSHLTVFSNYGKGFRPGMPGGRRASVCGGGFAPDVKADETTNYEVGIKSNSMDGRLQLNATAYRVDWKNVQQTILLTCGFLETQNTGTARSQGVELEASARPLQYLSLDATVTYTDAKIRNAPAGAAASAGSPILFVPKWKVSFGAGLDVPAFSDWRYIARADATYESRALIDYATGFARSGYATFGARFGIKNDSWQFEVFGQNLSNERPLTNLYTFATPLNANLNSTIRPRTVGIRGTKDF